MANEKFYHFEEDPISGRVTGGGSGSKITPAKIFVGFLIVALAAALIGVLIYYNTGDRKNRNEAGSTGQQSGGSGTTLTSASVSQTVISTSGSSQAPTSAPSPEPTSPVTPLSTVTPTSSVTPSSSVTPTSTVTPSSSVTPTSSVSPSSTESPSLLQRIDCIPEAKGQNVKVTEELCSRRGCIYDQNNAAVDNIPSCYFSPENTGYTVTNVRNTPLGFKCDLDLKSKGPFGFDLSHMEFEVQMLGNDIIRFKFDDPLFQRYKVPIDLDLPAAKGANPKYDIRITNNETFAFQIIRKSTNKVLWDTSVGGLVLSDQFLQISTKLPSENIYGFGENPHKSFRHDLNFQTWPMFSRDQAPGWTPHANLYGVHPFYTCLEEDGNSHGVLLLNSNAQDYSFTPLPMLTYRTIGGILDFYMFLGPEPENVVQQYTGAIGRPYMPPYWSLGFQLCRYGYKSLEKLQEAVNRTKQYNIPHDVQYADIDHMDTQMDFTIDQVNFAGLPDYFEHLRDGGMRTIIILDPCLISNVTGYEPYDNLTDIEGSITWPGYYNPPDDDQDKTGAVLGYVWPVGKVVFPDFFKNSTCELWKRLIVKHRQELPFDALWIDMNEPANFGTNLEKPWNWPEHAKPYWSLECPENARYEDPPYRTKAAYVFDNKDTKIRISDKTICMVATQGNNDEYRHYDVHSLYGWSQTQPTLEAVRAATGERSLVLTRSTYPSSGKHSGHWLGDNDSQWSNLAESIIGMLEFNLFGIPYIGADICGFFGNTTVEMCKRWMQLGAFYPFSRNHNGIDFMEQDPGYFGPEVATASREALETRYWLLPYLYTLFHRAHKDGHTVVRPLFHEFPRDSKTYGIDRQFLWGPALMIVPILEQSQTKLNYYLPQAWWYDFYTGSDHFLTGDMSLSVTQDSKIGLYVRGGYILPMQQPANNTHFSRQNSMKLLVALDMTPGNMSGTAKGELFWDDGNSVDTYENGVYFYATFRAEKDSLSMKIEHNSYQLMDNLRIDEIQVYGAPSNISDVYVDHFVKFFDFNYDTELKVLTIERMGLSLNTDFTVTWRTQDMSDLLDCNPEAFRGVDVLSETECVSRSCIYDTTHSQLPSCLMSPKDYGYEVVSLREDTELGFKYLLKHKGKAGPYSSDKNKDIEFLNFEVEMRGNDVLRFKFDDANNTGRYKVPKEMNLDNNKAQDPRYEVKVTNTNPFSFQVIRKSDQQVLWDTGVGGLIFSDQFLQISTALPSSNIYGFGENVHHSFRHDLSYQKWPLFARDQPVPWGDHNNHYGVHPYYMCMENDGQSHGVLLLNSNAQDYSFTPLPMLTYRTIGGILDFYMFLGPEPENVVQQYTGAIGRPYMPPYWSLGFQLCRYGYNSISNVKAAVDRTRDAGIPHDVQYVDIDHMDERKDFTIVHSNFPGLNDYFKSLQNDGMSIIIILDPALISNETNYDPYEQVSAVNGSIMWAQNEAHIPADSADSTGALLGYVWPKGKAVFPDFFKNDIAEVWKDLIIKHHSNNLTFDGLWIDMNEPASFGTNEERPFNWPEDDKPYWSLNCSLEGNTLEHPPYRTMAAYTNDGNDRKAMLSDKTVCMRAVQGKQGQYLHYDVHNLYGWSQTLPTLQGLRAATGERGMVISRSTFPGSGKYAGHWLGDNESSWEQLRLSIIGILEFNLFGIPYIGADICGFFQDTNPELCLRWMQLGAFYTFNRNHNGLGTIDQDPAALGPDVLEASKVVLETKYFLLPYLYTLFHKAHVDGNTVIHPLHHVFPRDEATYGLDTQFMWGSALLISPIYKQGQTELEIYLPEGPWYDFYTGAGVDPGHVTLPVDLHSRIPLHVHGGHILPLQAPANNTHYSRKNPFTLKVALEDSDNHGLGWRASGELFWDDGSSIDTYENGNYYHAKFQSDQGNNFELGWRASGELFWDDGSSIDTYENGNYYYAKFQSDQNQLRMTVEYNKNSYIDGLYIESVIVMGVRSQVNYIMINNVQEHSHYTYNSSLMVLTINNLKLSLNTNFILEWSESRQPTPDEQLREDCYPDIDDTPDGAAQTECERRGCIFDPVPENTAIAKCYINRMTHGYTRQNDSDEGNMVLQRKSSNSIFGGDIETLQVQIDESSNEMLRIKIFDPANKRYEVPIDFSIPQGSSATSTPLYVIEKSAIGTDFYIKVTRKTTGKVIWDTSVSSLIFSDQYLQLSSKLPSENVYGFGEHRHFTLKHSFNYQTWPIFARDTLVNDGDYSNLYSVHPFYMNIEDDDGNSHAVLLHNSNAMEVLLQPGPKITYRTIGGIFDFYLFLGPEPETVIQQYTQVIGYPYMPPYWALGFQLCRYGYNSLDNMKAAVNRTKEAKIPHDIQYADIDHMDERNDFTIDPVNFAGLSDYFKELQAGGMHTIIILDPGFISNISTYRPYNLGVEKDAFIKWGPGPIPPDSSTDENYLLGYVWPKGKTVFPDFFKNSTHEMWKELIVEHYKTLPFDGLWIDMNEPTNFGTNELKPHNWPDKDTPYWSLKCNLTVNKWDQPPYKPRSTVGEYLSDKTICMQSLQLDGQYTHYDVHSLYGWSETQPTMVALREATKKRGIVVSRSTYPSSGHYGGSWLGDNESKWSNLHDSIIGIIEYNLFGIPYIGADICGFIGDSNAEMCQRWMQLGAFYTFSRNHNMVKTKDQDPGIFGVAVSDSSRRAMEIRYSLLPFLYTQFYRVTTQGGTVLRSMLHEFPQDKRTWAVDTQFMWGSALLIAPVLQQGHITKDVYFPAARWFDYYTGEEIHKTKEMVTVNAPRDYIPLFLRGGYILPTQEPANNTVFSRTKPLGLLVVPDASGKSVGDLFWDDGDSIDTIQNEEYFTSQFTLDNTTLTMSITHSHSVVNSLIMDNIWVYGVDTMPKTVKKNTADHNMFVYNSNTKMLRISKLNLPLSTNFTMSWS